MSVLTFPGADADSADHGRSVVDGMCVLTFPGTGADSADHGRSGVDGISLPTFPVTGADSPVHAYFGDDGISLLKYVLLTHPITYLATNVHSNCIFSSSPYFFPENLPIHQGVVYIIRPILWRAVCGRLCLMVRYGTGQIRDSAGKYCGQLFVTGRGRPAVFDGTVRYGTDTGLRQA